MKKTFSILTVAAVTAGALTMPPRALAHGSVGGERESNLRTFVEQSNLVLVGDVADVSYRNARIEGGGGVLPHAIVTYKIRTVLRGKAPGGTFTMRFVGGPDGQGRFTSVSGVPMFQPGEQDVLFVAGNGENGCALVQCEWGRFRILKEAIYNTHGSPVFSLDKEHALARGTPPEELRSFRYPTPKFDELIKNPEVRQQLKTQKLSLEQARKRYEAEAPKIMLLQAQYPAVASERGDGRAQSETPAQTASSEPADADPAAEAMISRKPVSLAAFLAVIKRIASTSKRKPAAIGSVNPKAEIVLKAFRPRVPEKAAGTAPRNATQTAQEQAELEALAAQDFNPVIKR